MVNEKNLNIDVIIPAFNEEKSIGKVIDEIPKLWVREIIVCNNNSKDNTKDVARAHGATVVDQVLPGYGNACLKGLAHIAQKEVKPDIVVFLDGDYSDYPSQLPALVKPILDDDMDLVIGSRVLGRQEKGSLTPQQVFGNWLATSLIHLFYKYKFTDLGPFRAVKYQSLLDINMVDKNFGWTVEMQVKAAKLGMKCVEVPVDYRQRIGVSKVSGTVRGTILAGHKILWTIFKLL